MTINFQPIFISFIISEKKSGCKMKEKKSCLKALAWLELAEGYLNLVTKHLQTQNKCMHYLWVAFF